MSPGVLSGYDHVLQAGKLCNGRRKDGEQRFGDDESSGSAIAQHVFIIGARHRCVLQYVPDLIRVRGDDVVRLLKSENTYVYICGLKGMETGVNDALKLACGQHGLNCEQLRPQLRAEGRYHVEAY
jgi:sulfite reductase alpha subunit-like flavoprotein